MLKKKYLKPQNAVWDLFDGQLEKSGEQNSWKLAHNGKNICKVWASEDESFTSFFLAHLQGEYADLGAEFEACMQEHVQICYVCHEGCTGGFDLPIFGKDMKNVCSQHTINFKNPDEATLAHIKTLVDYCKTVTPTDISYHANNG